MDENNIIEDPPKKATNISLGPRFRRLVANVSLEKNVQKMRIKTKKEVNINALFLLFKTRKMVKEIIIGTKIQR